MIKNEWNFWDFRIKEKWILKWYYYINDKLEIVRNRVEDKIMNNSNVWGN